MEYLELAIYLLDSNSSTANGNIYDAMIMIFLFFVIERIVLISVLIRFYRVLISSLCSVIFNFYMLSTFTVTSYLIALVISVVVYQVGLLVVYSTEQYS